jgi:hypothetical protein
MISVLLLLALGGPAAPNAAAAPVPRELSCVAHNTSDGRDRKCHVRVPEGATLRPCTGSDKAAGHCTAHPRGRIVAWIVATQGADCVIARKKTDWTHRVGVRVGRKTRPGAGTCELRVAVQ